MIISIDPSLDWDGIWDRINNLGLIENSLIHIKFELTREKPSCFRIARESHLLFYRSMIEALRGTDNRAVMYQNLKHKRKNKTMSHWYRLEGGSWLEIHKIKVKGCARAWRYSSPNPCEAPKNSRIDNDYKPQFLGGRLINFYEALAKIQAKPFMSRFAHSREIPVPDRAMLKLEWVHENIRNEYEHFEPKYYLAPIKGLLGAAILCIFLTKKLLFESGNVLIQGILEDRFKELFQEVSEQVKSLRSQATHFI